MTRPLTLCTPAAFSFAAQSSNNRSDMPSAVTMLGSPEPIDEQVAVQPSRIDPAGGQQSRLVREVPAQPLGGGRERHGFHVRRGDEEPSRVEVVERLVGFQRLDQHAPVAVREGGVAQNGVDVALERGVRVRGVDGPA